MGVISGIRGRRRSRERRRRGSRRRRRESPIRRRRLGGISRRILARAERGLAGKARSGGGACAVVLFRGWSERHWDGAVGGVGFVGSHWGGGCDSVVLATVGGVVVV